MSYYILFCAQLLIFIQFHLLFRNAYSVEGRIYGAYDLMSHHVNISMQLAQSVTHSLPQATVTQYEETSWPQTAKLPGQN